MNILAANKSIMRSKFKKALLANFDLMNDLLVASAIMSSEQKLSVLVLVSAKILAKMLVLVSVSAVL
jgi:hypothetical protein